MAEHSYWSASGFAADMQCPGKKVMEEGKPDNANEHAASGTATHQVITWALQGQVDAWAFLGRIIQLDERGRVLKEPVAEPAYEFVVDEDRAGRAQQCVDYTRDVAGATGLVLVDQRVNYARHLGVAEDTAWGTLDVTVVKGPEIIVIDYKDGKKPVSAGDLDAPDGMYAPNPQLALYGLGAIDMVASFADEPITKARLVIIQPRVSSNPVEYDITVKALLTWAASEARHTVERSEGAAMSKEVRSGIDEGWVQSFLRPGDACTFCRAKGTCPALRDDMTGTTIERKLATPDEFGGVEALPVGDFSEMDWLEAIVAKADLWESMFAAARGELERRLLAGETAKQFKVVQGKRGNREWVDPEQVAAYLKDTVRLNTEEMYTLKLKGPAPIEKLAPKLDKEGKPKPVKEGEPQPLLGPRQWAKLQKLITQRDGKPHVAPINDPRPALAVTPVADDFADVTATPDFSDFA